MFGAMSMKKGMNMPLGRLNDNFSIADVTDPSNPVEVFRTIGGNSSAWREYKTWGDYAYITCECGPGLLIVDMSPLPDTTALTYTYWVDDSITFIRHTISSSMKTESHTFSGHSILEVVPLCWI